MSSTPISMATKMFLTAIDVVGAAQEQERFHPEENSELDLIRLAQFVNKLVLAGFSIVDYIASSLGVKSENLLTLKVLEYFPRSFQLPISLMDELNQLDGDSGVSDMIGVVERGIISPVSDLIRVAAESAYHYEQHFLEMSPEELQKAKRPIFKFNTRNCFQIIGFGPVDLQECSKNAAFHQKVVQICACTRISSTLRAGTVAYALGKVSYDALATYLYNRFQRPVIVERRVFSLLALSYIPEPLFRDRIFSQYICPINQAPIRHPVRDPNRRTLYERSSIVTWLTLRPISPTTGRPLTISQLQETPAVQALIDQRLQHHEQQLWDYVVSSPVLRRSLASPSPTHLLAAAEAEHSTQ